MNKNAIRRAHGEGITSECFSRHGSLLAKACKSHEWTTPSGCAAQWRLPTQITESAAEQGPLLLTFWYWNMVMKIPFFFMSKLIIYTVCERDWGKLSKGTRLRKGTGHRDTKLIFWSVSRVLFARHQLPKKLWNQRMMLAHFKGQPDVAVKNVLVLSRLSCGLCRVVEF